MSESEKNSLESCGVGGYREQTTTDKRRWTVLETRESGGETYTVRCSKILFIFLFSFLHRSRRENEV